MARRSRTGPYPGAIENVRAKLAGTHGDRQMVKILSAVLTDGLQTIEAACAEQIDAGVGSAEVILNGATPTAATRCAKSDAGTAGA